MRSSALKFEPEIEKWDFWIMVKLSWFDPI